MTSTPALEQLSGAYLHEDWPEEYGTVWNALEDFVRRERRLAVSIPTEIDDTLREYPSEEELDRHFARLGSCFVPLPEEGGYHDWLGEMRRRAKELL